jgi:UDP-GlcNAc:undecaprenyl-phosphate GlcNAc-1-phosphate transferase
MIAARWQSGLIAFLAVLLLVPLVRVLCTKFRLYDLPGPLKIHTQPIPRLGGVAIALALILGVVAVRLPVGRSARFLLAAAMLVWISGLIDDVRGLHPAIRLIMQISAGFLLVHAGWTVPLCGNAMTDAAATCLYVVLFTNAFNFLDGADGIAAGVAAIIAIGYIELPNAAQNALGHASAWSLLGACAGFLLFNFPPAKIFMGDSGSSILGFVIVLLGLAVCRETGPAKSAFPLLLFSVLAAALPLVDALLAVLRRIRRRASPLLGDRGHFYDLLLARGWAARQVALACYAVTAALVMTGWITMRLRFPEAILVDALIGLAMLVTSTRLGALRSQDSSRNEGTKEDLRWPGMENHGLGEKV